MDHIAVYGPDNDKRLTGKHETAPSNKFSIGVADRGAASRPPADVLKTADQRLYRAKGKGRNQVVAKG
jgi:PleD family two-component response regulator